MFESRISTGATEKLPRWEKPHAKTVAWSNDMKGHAKKCVERYCELGDHHFKRGELETVGELSKVCSQIVLKCLYVVRSGRPDILWSVNKLARSVTKWTGARDRRLARLIFTTQVATDNIVMWETRRSALSIGFIPRLRFCW